MKIVKHLGNRRKGSPLFGIWPGKVLSDIPVKKNDHHVTHGGTNDEIHYVKVGNLSHDCFLWFDDLEEVRDLAKQLEDIADEAQKRNESKKG